MAMKGSEVPVLRRPDGQAKAGPIIRRATDLMTEENIACAIMAALLADLPLERQRICGRRRSSRCRRADRRERVGRARERGPREAAVLVHAADQVLHRGEVELRPDPVEECDVDRLAVEIAVEIEQEYL